WPLLADARHAGVQRLVRDLNRLYRNTAALHALDSVAAGFEWIDAQDAERSVYSWLRRDAEGGVVAVVCNMTPVPREGFRLGVPRAPAAWQVVLDTDAAAYGGSGMGKGMGSGQHSSLLKVTDEPSHGRDRSISLTLPPLATLFLAPA
ncbi:MAG: alpha amylase C-terminal domain-containing protein, partial [Burkholderiaceae bacterium]